MRVFIGLGSNLGDRRGTLRQAVRCLRERLGPGRLSSLYESAPQGWSEQDFFFNAVFLGEATAEPAELAGYLQSLEVQAGRQTGFRNGPRPLDLDLLVYGERQIQTPELVVPHPRLAERAFVLRPLWELAPELSLPEGSLSELLLALGFTEDLRRIAGPTWGN